MVPAMSWQTVLGTRDKKGHKKKKSAHINRHINWPGSQKVILQQDEDNMMWSKEISSPFVPRGHGRLLQVAGFHGILKDIVLGR